jgi:hypothetical protein
LPALELDAESRANSVAHRIGWVALVPTVTASIKHLAKLGITRETTGRNYRRIYAYDKYLKILNEGTEPLMITAMARMGRKADFH